MSGDSTVGFLNRLSGAPQAINRTIKRSGAALTANASTTYANIDNLSFNVVPGTYSFSATLPSTVANGTGGIKYCFAYTNGAVIGAIASSARGTTASAIATQNSTTTTSQTDLYSQAAVVIYVEITGTLTVTTGGTISLQMAQAASNASNTVALVGGSLCIERIA